MGGIRTIAGSAGEELTIERHQCVSELIVMFSSEIIIELFQLCLLISQSLKSELKDMLTNK